MATTTRRYRDKTYHTHLLRRTFREGGKVKHQTLGNISHLPEPIIELIRRALKGETLVNPDSAFDCVRSLPHGHVAAVLGTVKQLGLPTLIARQAGRVRDLVVALVVARVIDAHSKLATARALAPESAVSTLGEVLGLGDVDQHELYGAMDWLVERQAGIEQRLARRHLQEHTLVLCDLTSSYVEGTHCELARRGHNRHGKQGTLQIVIGLLRTAAGCPVAVEVFEGSTTDPETVASQVARLRERFGLERVVLVGDRGMLTAARSSEDGLRWITTLRAPAIRKLVAAGAVKPSLFDERDLAEVTSDAFPGERLIVCRNPLLAAERIDGLCIVRSNVDAAQFDAARTVRAYQDLSNVERAFRSLESVDLKVRPLHHRRADRLRAHVLLCLLAYYVEWHMRRALAPLLFDDHDPAAAEQQRPSVAATARRALAARTKPGRKRSADDVPVHSFRTLLTDLGTLSANTMQVAGGGATFTLQTQPTPLQQRCFELLGVTPRT